MSPQLRLAHVLGALLTFVLLLGAAPAQAQDDVSGHGGHGALSDTPWVSDGCTGVPDDPGGFDFYPACYNHDRCYRFREASRLTCDRRFRADMRSVCAAEPLRADRSACKRWAKVYYLGVRALGGPAYFNPFGPDRVFAPMAKV